MSNPILSIIIPVYNVEKYLRRCLDSVINQDYKNLEIIIVNDASTDNSQEIINEYQKKDKRIISIINEKNLKQGLTRNVGILKTTGEYIAFVDSDDWIEREMYEEMIKNALKYNSDIVECNIQTKNEAKTKTMKNMPNFLNIKKEGNEKYILNLFKNTLSPSSCNKIYKSEILKKNNIFFRDNNEISSEDLLFNINVINFISLLTVINKPFYHYIIHNNSVTHLSYTNKWAKHEKLLDYYVMQNKDKINFKNSFSNFSLLFIPMAFSSILDSIWETNMSKETTIELLDKMRKNINFHIVIKNNLINKNAGIKNRLFSLLFYLHFNYLLYILSYLFLILKNKKKYI